MLERLATATLDGLNRCDAGLVLAVAGGGSVALSALAGCQGASTALIAGQLAYSRAAAHALRDFDEPEGFASAAMALDLAYAALDLANSLDDRQRRLRLGVGIASALATQPPRAGRDRAYLAVAGAGPAREWTLNLDAWPGDRGRQEMLTAAAALLAAWRGAGCGPDEPATPDGLAAALSATKPNPAYWVKRVARGRFSWARRLATGDWGGAGTVPAGILAGSFNPLHAGHQGLIAAAERQIGAPVELELSLQNVDKDPLAIAPAVDRVSSIAGRYSLVIDRAATFVEKSALFPGAVFVVGADTATRIVDPRYYGGDARAMRSGLEAIRNRGCGFLVAGRSIGDRFASFASLDFSPAADLFSELPESAFRLDISSSQIRQERAD